MESVETHFSHIIEVSSKEGEFVEVCKIEDLICYGKKRVVVNKRDITLFRVNKEIFALDSVCYHLGGPLEDGDIEDLGGRNCIVCPWHKYKIDLMTGEGMYTDIKGQIVSKGKRQRNHEVKLINGFIYVKVDSLDQLTKEKLPSDVYAYKELYKVKRGPKIGPIHSKIEQIKH